MDKKVLILATVTTLASALALVVLVVCYDSTTPVMTGVFSISDAVFDDRWRAHAVNGTSQTVPEPVASASAEQGFRGGNVRPQDSPQKRHQLSSSHVRCDFDVELLYRLALSASRKQYDCARMMFVYKSLADISTPHACSLVDSATITFDCELDAVRALMRTEDECTELGKVFHDCRAVLDCNGDRWKPFRSTESRTYAEVAGT